MLRDQLRRQGQGSDNDTRSDADMDVGSHWFFLLDSESGCTKCARHSVQEQEVLTTGTLPPLLTPAEILGPIDHRMRPIRNRGRAFARASGDSNSDVYSWLRLIYPTSCVSYVLHPRCHAPPHAMGPRRPGCPRPT